MQHNCEIILLFAIAIVSVASECIRSSAIEIDGNTSEEQIRDMIKVTYKHRVLNAPKILTSIGKFPIPSQKYAGYRFLFNEMKENGDLFTKELMMLAYQLHLLGADLIVSESHLKYIHDNLPKNVRKLKWDARLTFRNFNFIEAVALVKSENLRVSPSSYRLTSKMSANYERFSLKPVEGTLGFRIYISGESEFLFAGNNTELYDFDRRKVMAGDGESFGDHSVGALWMFEPQSDLDSFRIYNMCYGEYLYLLDVADYVRGRDDRSVVLWRKYGCDGPQCEFDITDEL